MSARGSRQLAALVRDGGAIASTSGRLQAGGHRSSWVHSPLSDGWGAQLCQLRRRSGPGATGAPSSALSDPAKRADERLARHLGLPAIPLPKSFVDSHRGVDPTWRVHRVPNLINHSSENDNPKDKDGASRHTVTPTLIVQDARRPGITPEREYFGVGEQASNTSTSASASNDNNSNNSNNNNSLADSSSSGSNVNLDRAPALWKWLANSGFSQNNVLSTASYNASANERHDVWVMAERIQPPPLNSSPFDDVRGHRRTARTGKGPHHLLFNVKQKGTIPARIELTAEGEALVEHVAVNALLYQEGRQGSESLYLSFLGLHGGVEATRRAGYPGLSKEMQSAWSEQNRFHSATSQRINWLGEQLRLNGTREDRKPVVMCEPYRLNFTALPYANPGDRWLIACVVPPASVSGTNTSGSFSPIGGSNARMKDNPAIVADLVEAIDFSRRTGARLAIVGLELAGTHVRRAPETRGFDSGFDPNMLHDVNHDKELTQADVHWRLQRQDLVEAVEHAARAHAKVHAASVRESTQRAWLDDWTHQGLRLEEASALVVEGKRSPEWAIDWFGGFAGPYLPRGGAVNPASSLQRHTQHTQAGNSIGDERTPSGFFLHGSPMASIARVFNGVFGVGAPVWATSSSEQARRREFIKADAEPLMRETARYLGHEISERECLESLAAHDVSGANEFLHEYNLREESTSRGPGGAGSSDSNKATAPVAGTTTPGEDPGETAVLFHAFRKFRNNVDLMTTRVAASYLNLAFGHVLGRVEQLRENNPTDAGLLPLHRMTSEWIERLVEHYRDYLVDGNAGIGRQVYLKEADKVARGAHALIDRCDDLKRSQDDLRVRYELALNELKLLSEDVERGIAKGDADAMAMAMGADVERTYDLSDEATANVGVDDDFTSVQWFESLRRLEEAIAKLEAFEPNVTEESRVYGQLDGKFTRVMAYDLPPYAPDAYEDSIIDEESNSLDSMDPERVATAEEIARSIASDSGSVIDTGSNNGSDGESSGVAPGTDADQSDDVVHATTHTPVSIDLKATVDAFRMRRSTGRSTRSSNATKSFENESTGNLESESTFDSSDESTFDSSDESIVRAGPGEDFPLVDEGEMLSMYDELLKMLNDGHAALLAAYKLRRQMRVAAELVAATEKIDPSGIRTAVQTAKANGAPHSTVVAAEEKLRALEDEISAFIRAKRRSGSDSLLPAPKQGWSGAGRHVWYNEKDELGRGSLGTAVYAGVYDEQEGRNTVVRRPAAIKRIPLPPGERKDAVRALVEREVGLHRFLNQNSKRVTFLYGVHLDGNDAVFTAMERCGESLSQWLSNAPDGRVANLPPRDRVDAAAAIVAAVADVHAANVVHNDIKPDNCLRASTGEFKLADLGLGVRMKDADRGSDSQYSMTTFAGYGVNVQMTGRPPEVLQGDSLTTAVDVWSLGNLIYTTLTGSNSPYSEQQSKGGDTIAGLYENQRIIKGNFSLNALETAKLPRHVVSAARHVVHDMLQPDPTARPTAVQVRDHPLFWSTERCVEAVRDVYDQRILNDLTPEEEAFVIEKAWGETRETYGKRTTRAMQGWKDQIVPELRQRLVARQRMLTDAGSNSGGADKGGSDETSFGPDVSSEGRKKTQGGKKGGANNANNNNNANNDGNANGNANNDGTGYESSIRDLFRLVRNLHEHPPLDINRGDRTKHAMTKSMGTLATTLSAPRSDSDDPWSNARRVVEGYLTHTFPELPIVARYLLEHKEQIERLKSERRSGVPIGGSEGTNHTNAANTNNNGAGTRNQGGGNQSKGGNNKSKGGGSATSGAARRKQRKSKK